MKRRKTDNPRPQTAPQRQPVSTRMTPEYAVSSQPAGLRTSFIDSDEDDFQPAPTPSHPRPVALSSGTSHAVRMALASSGLLPGLTSAAPTPPSAGADLAAMTVPQLKALCKQHGLKQYSSLKKQDLLARLSVY
jgi:hypothetical protein